MSSQLWRTLRADVYRHRGQTDWPAFLSDYLRGPAFRLGKVIDLDVPRLCVVRVLRRGVAPFEIRVFERAPFTTPERPKYNPANTDTDEDERDEGN